MQRDLRNYLRTHRLRLGLSQKQLASLLGYKGRTRMSEMEKGRASPPFHVCLAIVFLFKRSLCELWPQHGSQIEKKTKANIRRLIRALDSVNARTRRRKARIDAARRNLAVIVNDYQRGK